MRSQLHGIAAFVEAAEAASFAVAAERMGLSRSAIGKSVARLEARLGVQLFHRTTRSLSLTDEGALFYERCAGALADIGNAEQSMASSRAEPNGRIRISLPVLLGRRCIAPILVALGKVHRQLELDVTFTDRPADLVDDGIDLAVRTGALPNEAGLKARRLGEQSMVVCAAPAYLQARGTPTTLDQLAAHDMLPYGTRQRLVPWRFLDQGHQREVAPMGRIRFDDLEAIADAATAGCGMAWLPAWLVAARLETGELVEVLDAVRGPGFDIHALWPAGRFLPVRVRLVIDTLVQELPGVLALPGPHARGPK
jgi:DNA-binding transcriptional LysR family regulator